jgi:hypothetical protein
MSEELTAWKMRSGLMNSVHMKQSSLSRNRKIEASHQLNIWKHGVLTCKLPDPINGLTP